jgi:hypothetical protein
LIGRRINKILWAITLLHNVDILEIYEEAIQQTDAHLQRTPYQKEQANMGEVEMQPPAQTLEQSASTHAAAQAAAGPKARHPRLTKAIDPAKQQRQLQHMQTP